MSQLAKKMVPTTPPVTHEDWNYRVLAVDDEVEIADIYVRSLSPKEEKAGLSSSRGNVRMHPKAVSATKEFPFEVDVATSYDEAVAKFDQALSEGRPYAMGFFDVRLGSSKDGVQLVKELFEKDPDFMAVFVTAHNDRSLDSFQQTLGPSYVDRWDYVNKPFNPAEVIQQARGKVTLWNLRREHDDHALQMEELNQKVNESERLTSVAAVARGVAHEFGNLLMQIVGKAEISKEKSQEEMKEALDQIINAGQVANEILDRFHSLADNKSTASEKEMEDVSRLMKGAHDLLSHQFRKANIQFVWEKEDSVYAEVHGTSLLQVFVNLMINAVHAMKAFGGIIYVSVEDQGGSVKVKIRDNGPGVSDEHLAKISEPFYTTKGKDGNGLGLSICKEIIEIDHRGEFKLGNHPDGGFEIQMDIPTKQEEQ